ncbi:MAG: serine hydrolase [Clostridia bacterium]|nr:serine hydrolase [Clostridia bacterium]
MFGFSKCTPESVGVSSAEILKLLQTYDEYKLSTHSVVIAKGRNIIAEAYYKPFDKDFLHRIYSVTKSFMAVSVGLAQDEGLLSLDDKMVQYFPEYENENWNDNFREMTIRDMLTMSTTRLNECYWFTADIENREEAFFKQNNGRIPGTIFSYDSQGSFMLGTIVEKVTGKPFLDYMKEKFLTKIGFSDESYCLKCPGGHSWSDSAIICTPRDLLTFARFVANKGEWDGVQYVSRSFMEAAASPLVDNDSFGATGYNSFGYGYQIWGCFNGGFLLNGMGCQFAVYDPKTDMIMVINSDNQGNKAAHTIIFHKFCIDLVRSVSDSPLPEDPEALKELSDYIESRKLVALEGRCENSFADEINGVTYAMEKNPMGIEWIRFRFLADGKAIFEYKNAQGEKELPFGLGYNEFSKFPEEGYSDIIGKISCPGNKYDCAVSGIWSEDKKLRLKVQVIDKYFGNICMIFSFKDERLAVRMVKNAEAFLNEYDGYAMGKKAD